MSGGIWAVGVPARAALQCLIGHFPLRRSLIIVQAPAHSRSGSTKPRTSTHLHVGAAAAVAVTVTPCSSRVRPGGGKKGAGGLKSRVRDPPRQSRLSNTQHHARPLKGPLVRSHTPLTSPVGRWERPPSHPSPRRGDDVLLVSCMRGCPTAAYYHGTKTTAPAHHSTRTKCVTGLRCPPHPTFSSLFYRCRPPPSQFRPTPR